ncbi:serine hydrolase domain-containing protein [candidate division KSB1 bacterium]
MIRKIKIFPIIVFLILFWNIFVNAQEKLEKTGINLLKPSVVETIDKQVAQIVSNYSYIKIALVRKSKIVLSKAYGTSGLEDNGVYCSVSKPVTSMILMQLVEDGKIKSIEDNIWDYSVKYKNCMPEKYKNSSLTFKHLLTHSSGIPHNNEPLWNGDKLNLKFEPGSQFLYSTPGYGVIGDIIERVTGKSFNDLLKEYIGEPAGAGSFGGYDSFITPGAFVYSTIEDMALFSIGVMDNIYISSEILYNTVLKDHFDDENINYGLGWGIRNQDSEELTASHSGSNGTPKSFLIIKPRKKQSVSILALKNTSQGNSDLRDLADDLLLMLSDK